MNCRVNQVRSAVLAVAVLFSALGFSADKTPIEPLHTYSPPEIQSQTHKVAIASLKQDVQVRVFLPPDYANAANRHYPSLYVNDGQDAEAAALAETLQKLYADGKISPVIVVAVSMLPDRMGTYGYSDGRQSLVAQTRYGPVGTQAHAYSDWLAHSLVPFIDSHYRTTRKPQARTMLGWSLGAANAFNIAWNYPSVFGRMGGFSPSFWLSAKPGDASTAVVQSLITKTPMPKNFSMWLAAGSAEEADDRDGDGVIDVIDDSQNVIAALQQKNTQVALPALHIYPGGQHNQGTWKAMLPDFLQWAYPLNKSNNPPIPKPSIGTIERLDPLHSEFVPDRAVDVWLPPGYSQEKKYAVLYMQDGQMLFDADITWNKQEWRADEVAAQLMAEGKTRPFIIVGVHNNGSARHSEYFPQKPFESLPEATRIALMQSSRKASQALFSGDIASDAYLMFLVKELKPHIDEEYSVYTDAAHTAVMGSSMGGLISLYAISEFPKVFGAAACLSTHWPGAMPKENNPVPEAFFAYMHQNLPDPATHRLYFDHGTETLDAVYPLLQVKADAVIKSKGYTAANWQTQVFPGADHSEKSWSTRLAIPLQFLFGLEK